MINEIFVCVCVLVIKCISYGFPQFSRKKDFCLFILLLGFSWKRSLQQMLYYIRKDISFQTIILIVNCTTKHKATQSPGMFKFISRLVNSIKWHQGNQPVCQSLRGSRGHGRQRYSSKFACPLLYPENSLFTDYLSTGLLDLK